MPPTLTLRLLGSIFLIFILPSCAEYFSSQPLKTTTQQNIPYSQSTIDDLLAFGASMTTMPDGSRADLCISLVDSQKKAALNSVQLQLMVGRLLSDACGDIPKIVEDIEAIEPKYASDDRLQRLITINLQALKRMHKLEHKKRVEMRKSKKTKMIVKPKDVTEPTQNEADFLREKLEAIRSIDKQMNDSVDTN